MRLMKRLMKRLDESGAVDRLAFGVMIFCMELLLLVGLTGCTSLKIVQTDYDPVTEAETTTTISGTAWFSSAQEIAKIKATQSSKTQSVGTEGIAQHGATNTVEMLRALAELMKAVPRP